MFCLPGFDAWSAGWHSPDNTAVVYCDGADVLAIGLGQEEGADQPYDPAMFIPGTRASGALMAQIVFPRAVTFPAGFAGSQGYAQVAATASTTLDVLQNGMGIGSITFGAGSGNCGCRPQDRRTARRWSRSGSWETCRTRSRRTPP